MTNIRKSAGFTLVELMIVVVIIAVLASVAYPSYTSSVRKGNRTDAISTLLRLQLEQERFRTVNTTYFSNMNASTLSTDGNGNYVTPEGFYQVTVSGVSGSGYTLTATAVGDQASDSCASFSVNQDGPVLDTAAQKTCWNRS